ADIPVLDPDYPRGQFTWWQPVINADGKRYYLDSMYIVSTPGTDSSQNILLDLDVVQAKVTGRTPLTKVWPIVQDHINRHYAFQTDSTKKALAAVKTITTNTPDAKTKKQKDVVPLPTDYDLQI